jgi:thiosulfate/3-mercaptopyruvate sulfurtransferase
MDDTPPGSLVSTEWLAQRLGNPRIRPLDVIFWMPGLERDLRAEHAERRIPGAAIFDVDDVADPAADLPHMLPAPDLFAEKVGALGIGNDDLAVCYDAFGILAAPRAWWMFRAMGHDRVAVLDGGLPKWLAEGRPTESGLAEPAQRTFRPAPRPELVRGADDVAGMAGGPEQLVDVRGAERFAGQAPEVWPGRRWGHVPGSLNLPFPELIDPDTGTLLPPEAIAERARAAGVDLTEPVTAMCGSGVTATILALALDRIGRSDVAVYDGSWADWGRDDDRPLATGPAGRPG